MNHPNLNDKAVQKQLATQWGYVDQITERDHALVLQGELLQLLIEEMALHTKKYASCIECQRCGRIIT